MAFRPGLGPTLAVVAVLPMLLALGTWQVQRLHWKTELITTLAARQAEAVVDLPATDLLGPEWSHRKVHVTATLIADPALRFGARAVAGVPGHHVLQLARLEDGRWLVVDRGWRADRSAAPLATPDGAVALVGVLRWLGDVRSTRFTPPNDVPGNRWYRHDRDAYERALGAPVLPVLLSLTQADPRPGTPVPQPLAVDLPNPHLGYAVTWYGLAAGLVVVYLVHGWRPERSRP